MSLNDFQRMTFKIFDFDALESLIEERMVIKIEELKRLTGNDELFARLENDTKSDDLPPLDKFYPKEPVTPQNLYVRERVNDLREKKQAFIDVKQIENNWHLLSIDYKKQYVEQAAEINANYLSLNPPKGLKPSEIKVPSLPEAMERIFFGNHVFDKPSHLPNINARDFVDHAAKLKRTWNNLTDRDKLAYVPVAAELIDRWEKAAKPIERKIPLPTDTFSVFEFLLRKEDSTTTCQDVQRAWEQERPSLVCRARDYAIQLNQDFINLTPSTYGEIPSISDFMWRLYANDELCRTNMSSEDFSAWLKDCHRAWGKMQGSPGAFMTYHNAAEKLQQTWVDFRRTNVITQKREVKLAEEEIEDGVGPNVIKKPKETTTPSKTALDPKSDKKQQLKLERKKRELERRASKLYHLHYRQNEPERFKLGSVKVRENAEKEWQKLDANSKKPYYVMAREMIALKEKQLNFFKSTSLPNAN